MKEIDNIRHLIATKEQLLKQFPDDHFLEKSIEQLKKTQLKFTDKNSSSIKSIFAQKRAKR